MKLYIAGPMTGLPEYNFPAFHSVAANLRGKGHEVVNPAELQAPDDTTWPNYMRGALRAMLTCEAVVLLPGWVRSNGARLERMVADRLLIPVYDYVHFEITEEK